MNTKVKKKHISFSQFSTHSSCNYKFYRDYILQEKKYDDNIIMMFGTAIHCSVQLYLKILFNIGEKKAESIDIMKYFIWKLKKEIKKKNLKCEESELNEFIDDGKNILNEFKEPYNRLMYFPRNKWELLGIEIEIKSDVKNSMEIIALLDLVLKEKISGNIKIIDFKTSTMGWRKSNKEDEAKINQLILYKTLYSKKYNIPLNNIQVQFFILKRKLYSKSNYEQSRLQVFNPPVYKNDIVKLFQKLNGFLDECFTMEGEFKKDIPYPKMPGKYCQYCQYSKNNKCDQIP